MKMKLALTLLIVAGFISAPLYAKKPQKMKQLPHGLQKKVERGKPLPPGWQKKIARGEVLDSETYKRGKVIVPLDKNGLVTMQVDGKVVRLFKATREIFDVLQ